MIDTALLQDFITETREHLDEMESSLLKLENDTGNTDFLNDIFRSAHTIKGAAGFVGIKGIGELSHKLENLLEILRYGSNALGREIIDALIQAKDRMDVLVRELEQTGEESSEISDLTEHIEQLTAACEDGEGATAQEEPDFMPVSDDVAAELEEMEGFADEPEAAEFEGEDNYDEEHDKELFEIFLEHLRENLSAVVKMTNELPSSENKGDLLLTCLENINSLHSSANYMEYSNLADYYEKWRAEMGKGLENLSEQGENVFDASGFANLMRAYIREIVMRFPQLGDDFAIESEDSAEPEIPDLMPVETPEDDVAFGDLADFGMSDEPDVDVSDLGIFEAFEEESFAEEAIREEADDVDADDDMQGLFDELDDAFGDHDGLYEELDDVFGDFGETSWDFEDDAVQTIVETAKKIKAAEAETARGDVPEISAPPLQPPPVFDKFTEKPVAKKIGEKPPEAKKVEKPPVRKVVDVADTKPAAETPPAPQRKTKAPVSTERSIKSSLRVDAGKIDSLMNQVGELVVSRAWFSQLYTEMKDLQSLLQYKLDQREMKPVKALAFRISEATTALGRVANDLQEGVMKVRMLPIAQLFNRYPRLIRDLTHNTDKVVRLEIIGEETELDKMVIEEIGDPLIHIIRNAVDHGCETIKERRESGKPDECTLKLESYHESNHVVIEISDDGRGVDTKRIKTKALEKQLHSQEELDRMSERELMGIIMKPGFSTAAEVTETSGRGVGMDVVKENVEKLNGTIEVESKPGVGTRFKIKIPLTLAIIQALLVRVGQEIFTVPLAAVEETLRIYDREITWMEGVEVIHLRDYTLPLLRLSKIFNIKSNNRHSGKAFVVVVNSGMRNVGLVVDVLIGQEEVVIKPLVDYLQESSGFSGATILGDGRISLILDIYELINLSIGMQMKRKSHPAATGMDGKAAYLEAKAMINQSTMLEV